VIENVLSLRSISSFATVMAEENCYAHEKELFAAVIIGMSQHADCIQEGPS